METLIAATIALSGSPEGLAQLLGQWKAADAVLDNPVHDCLAAVAQLDAEAHSLAIVFLLNAHARRPNGAADAEFAQRTSSFLRTCTSVQIHMVPEAFCMLCHCYARALADSARTARLGIAPLLSAVKKLAPSEEHLTPIHADVLHLCLVSKALAAASPLLAADPTEVDPSRTSLTPQDVLLYCYYGGTVALGRKQLPRALQLLLQGLTAPTMASSAITAMTYRKYVLACLLHHGACSSVYQTHSVYVL